MNLGPVYDSFVYIEPTRTEVVRGAESLPVYEEEGRWAQYKRNGTRSVIFNPPNRKPFVIGKQGERFPAAWNRHGEPHAVWHFTESTWDIFRSIPGNRWCVFDGELLHRKIHYLYDILVWDGHRLTGTTYAERYALLWEIFSPKVSARSPRRHSVRMSQDRIKPGHIVLDDHTWLARNYFHDLRGLFDSLTEPDDEGLVLRNPSGVYLGTRADAWMTKVRKVDSPGRRDR